MQFTREEVIDALDKCSSGEYRCSECPFKDEHGNCSRVLKILAKELIINNTNKGEEKMAETEKKTKAELLDEIKKLEGEVKRLERFKAYEDQAGELKGMYDSYVNAGFTDSQAFDLVKVMLNKVKLF